MIAIVGAGITGLYLAHRLRQQGEEVQLFEAQEQVGGNIGTVQAGDYLFETGPNSLRMNADFHQLLTELDLLDQAVYTAPAAKKRYVLRDGAYRAIPSGPVSLLLGSFFKFKVVRRLLRERRIPAENIPHETIDAFFRRRFGDPVADYLVAPFISGIYAGDPTQLLVEKAFPKIKAWENEFGSVLKGFFRGRKKSEFKGIFSLQHGLGQLTDALAEALGDRVQTNMPLTGLQREGKAWKLQFKGQTVVADRVVLALKAPALAGLLAEVDAEAAAAIGAVSYPAVSVVQAAYPRSAISHPLDGFGALHNHLEPSETLGTIFSSTIFPGRCPADEVLLTTFVGGARTPERAQLTDAGVLGLAQEDHRRFLGAQGAPVWHRIVRWKHAIPQYDTEILAAHAALPRLAGQSLYCAGNWTHGISVPSCLERAQQLCEQLTTSHPANSVI